MVEGDKDMGKTQIVVESIWGREKENVRVAKKERKKVMVEGEGEGEREGGVEEGGGEGEDGVGGSRSHTLSKSEVGLTMWTPLSWVDRNTTKTPS